MTMTLNLEIAQGVTVEDMKKALTGVAYSDLSETDCGFSVVLTNTNVSMWVKTNLQDVSILTEDLDSTDWSVGLRVYFDVDLSLSNPFVDIKKIIHNLSEQTSFEFALSFQYESLYAKKGPNGLELSGNLLS